MNYAHMFKMKYKTQTIDMYIWNRNTEHQEKLSKRLSTNRSRRNWQTLEPTTKIIATTVMVLLGTGIS